MISPVDGAPDPLWAQEEHTLYLPTHGLARRVELDGEGLTSFEDRDRRPYLQHVLPGGVQLRLTDWVGRLTFRVHDEAGATDHPCLVYPGKLESDPQAAFTALARLTDALTPLTSGLDFPQELVPGRSDGDSQPLSTDALRPFARQAWALWQDVRRAPRPAPGHTRRLVHGGGVPDRVDWALTLDHWGQGGFPDHMARDLAPLPPPPATAALHDLWDTLIAAARQSWSEDAPAVLGRFLWAQEQLPVRPPAGPGSPDGPARAAQALTARLRSLTGQATGLPQGHTRMADLYELWAMLALARALGACTGNFRRGASGLYEGTLSGPGVTVHFNPTLSFLGASPVRQQLTPDVLAVFDSGAALVADVKYRALHRLSTDQLRAVNDQMLRYMGLTHAQTGLVLWPGQSHEPLWRGSLPGDRARLARVRAHPLDPPGHLAYHLRQLGLPGVP